MTVKGAFFITLSGPLDQRADLLASLAESGTAAQWVLPEVSGPGEDEKGWVRATFHEGGDESPSSEFSQAALKLAQELGQPLGYELRSHGVVMGGAAQRVDIVDRRTGDVVVKGFGTTQEELPELARVLGIDPQHLELREPPGLWDVPSS
ncbi:hypothetical protein ACWEQP_13645 [Streptomyces sp. NPDC004044]